MKNITYNFKGQILILSNSFIYFESIPITIDPVNRRTYSATSHGQPKRSTAVKTIAISAPPSHKNDEIDRIDTTASRSNR